MKRTREYITWIGMRQRCLDPRCHEFAKYGGRGITICERWSSFKNFLADMGPRPEGMSIERINNDIGYEPSNCKWATILEQNWNRRGVGTATHCPNGHKRNIENVYIYRGQKQCRPCNSARNLKRYYSKKKQNKADFSFLT